MLFMVIERFKNGNLAEVGARFREKGRMLPAGVAYKASWFERDGTRCFQLMEAPNEAALADWCRRWDDLVDMEIVPVLTSDQFWAEFAHRR